MCEFVDETHTNFGFKDKTFIDSYKQFFFCAFGPSLNSGTSVTENRIEFRFKRE